MSARKIAGVLSLLALGVLVGGCASVQVKPVSVAQVNDPAIAGVRFFQPQPYLLVTEMPSHPMPPMRMLMMQGGMPHPMACRSESRLHGDMHHMMKAHHGMAGMNAPAGQHKDRMMPGRRSDAIHDGKPMFMGRPVMAKMAHMAMMARMMRAAHPQQRIFKLEIIYLPDYSRPYVANIQGGLGHSPNSILLANGWELLGLNVKGHVTPSRPIQAITAVPTMPHAGMMMHGNAMWQHGKHAWHKPTADNAHPWGQRRSHGMMHHPMMLPRHAAMAMGLHPGLYRFVFSAKTGKLEGLRCIRLLKPHHWHGHNAMKCKNPMWHKHHAMPPTTAPAAEK